jgi:hypothetical protein
MARGQVSIPCIVVSSSTNWKPLSDWQNIYDAPTNTVSGIWNDTNLYTALTCTTNGSVNYTVTVTGGTGNVTINGTSYALGTAVSIASGTQADITFVAGTSKNTSYGYGTFRIDVTSTNTIASFSLARHSSFNVSAKNNLLWMVMNLTSITTIPNSAFSGCNLLQSVNIPSTVTSIGNYAFQNCYSLQNAILPNGLTTLGTSAFTGCSSLQVITIPSGVTMIPDYVFQNCTSLTTVYILGSVTTFNTYCFANCYSLQTINIPSTVTSIGNYAFNACSSLANINLPSGLTTLGSSVFSGCTSLQTITIPSGVTSMNGNSLANCDVLQSINNLNNVTMSGVDWNISNDYNLSTFNAPNIAFTRLQLQCASGKIGKLNSLTFSASSTFSGTTSPQLDISYNSFTESEIVNVFNQLPNVSGKTIKITGNVGSASLTAADLLIATNKNWTVTQ